MRRTTVVSGLARHLTIAAVLACGAAACATNQPTFLAWNPGVGGTLPECPQFGEWSKVFRGDKRQFPGVAANGLLSLPKINTDVPEFHDCQKFVIHKKTGKRYSSLFAIFARDSLDSLAQRFNAIKPGDSVLTQADTSRAVTAGAPLAVAEVLAVDSAYHPLGILAGFNCLFLYGDLSTASGLAAKMVPVGGSEQQCATITNPMPLTGTILEVYRTPFAAAYVPPVARWDWDSVHNQQHIGLACGSGWCDIGANGFDPSDAHANTIASAGDQVYAVKGWYDEQRLAFPGVGTGPLSVGTVVGSFTPLPDLGSDTGDPSASRYNHAWVQVATGAVEDSGSTVYFKKLNFEPTTPVHSTVKVSLCFGGRADCIPSTVTKGPNCTNPTNNWWARVTSERKNETHYFCVTRRDHPGVNVPGVVRWRWAVKDETMWIRCLEGCCEVEAGSKDIM
jgi:hypothetical protein